MKLETRLSVLLGSLFALFLGALALLHTAQQRGAETLRREIAEDKARLLERVATLAGTTLERFAADYTQWDEMCAFVATPEPEWATINLQQSLTSWRFHGIWVLDADRREIYRHLREPFAPGELPDFPSAAMLPHLCTTERVHFFTDSPRGLLEIRAAPIHPSDDNRLGEPPRGWLVVARHWDDSVLAQLGALTDSVVAIEPPGTAALPRPAATAIAAQLPLPGFNGRPLHHLTLNHTSPLLAQMIDYDLREIVLYIAFGGAFLAAAAWFLNHWVRRPLRLLHAGLEADDAGPAAPLLTGRDEFAQIAGLIHTVADQRHTLRREVQDRTYAETELRRAMAERITLGRDLHDGVIQSIYATGMALQGLGPLLHTDPAEAQRRISACVDGLNRTIAQLRGHIAGLEQEAAPDTSLAEGLQHLLQEIRPARPVEYDVRLDPLLAAALPQDSIVQLLFIAREAISNALRHGLATHITLCLDTAGNEPAFTIADDGIGFTAGDSAHRGNGLDNMTRRAEEIGGALVVESIPGRGTRLRVELPWSGLQPAAATTPHPFP